MTSRNSIRLLAAAPVIATAVCAAAPGAASAQSAVQNATQSTPQSTSATSQATPAPRSGAAPKAKTRAATVKPVTVTAHTAAIRSSPDSRSYDLTRDPQSATGSVADVLRNVPSVQVSLDGKVSLRGDPSVVIYVDGKPSSLFKGPGAAQALQSMPADQYERVEVMTNPSAAYAPDGAAGIINLITKKTKKPGRWGSLKVSGGSQGRRNASFTASRRTDKLTLSFSAGVRHDRNASDNGDSRETLDGTGALSSTLSSAGRSGNVGDSGYASGTAEWNPDAKDQLTAELTGWTYGGAWSSRSRSATKDPSGDLTQLIERDGSGDYAGSGFSGGLTWRRTFDTDTHNLVVSLTREGGSNANSSLTPQTNLLPEAPDSFDRQHKGDSRPQTELKGDYTRPMPFEAVLKTGVDLRDEADRTDNSGFLAAASPDAPNDPGETDLFRFDRQIDAAYETYNQPIGRLTVLEGLRVEYTRIALDDETSRFTSRTRNVSLYPTLHLGWKLTERQRLTASYSGRVQRPWANQYDPFRFVYGPYSESQGNPDLKPEMSRKFELGWEYKHGGAYYAATTYYKHSDGGVANVTTDLGNGVFLSSPENLSRSQNGGLELIASGRLTKTLHYNLSGNDYWNQVDDAALGLPPRSGWSQSGHAGLDWQATPKDLIQLQGNFSGRWLSPQGFGENGPQISLGYRRKLDNRFTLQLTGQDVFGQAYSRSESAEPDTFRDEGWRKAHDRLAYASLIWNFGRGGAKKDPVEFGTPGGPG